MDRTTEFIRKATAVHRRKYDYSKTYYITETIKVAIICPTHGEFSQIPRKHIKGFGCLWCYSEGL